MEPLPSQQHGAEVEVLIYRLLPIFNNKKTDVHQLVHTFSLTLFLHLNSFIFILFDQSSCLKCI